MKPDIASLRREYAKEKLEIETVAKNPVAQFELWFMEALSANMPEVNAMTLSTVTETGRPTSRIVLLKGVENDRFVFFTNYQSNKGRELEANPYCALNFLWVELERQVRIEGVASRISEERSAEYFRSRPRGAQIGAWASPQSSVVTSRDLLESRYSELESRFKESEIPKPRQWGGYEVDPFLIEFWQGRQNRLHDRILFIKSDNTWDIRRLAP
ncbi:pyridoxamine 5'-phosphate oxidase [Oscillatoria amoena NRMC-F 0135]|nr:pyridoxamine 5'-phosphate oxidase [Oscillatoria amoena NRMC-F 0135]